MAQRSFGWSEEVLNDLDAYGCQDVNPRTDHVCRRDQNVTWSTGAERLVLALYRKALLRHLRAMQTA